MLTDHKITRLLEQGAVLLVLALLATSFARADEPWADEPAAMTVGEFLDLQFRISMERPESEALNSFSLVSFYPSSDPQRALVVVIQTWRDDRLSATDLRREIRKVGGALTGQFESLVRLRRVESRWKIANPKTNVVIRHVRLTDLRETLAVTRNGETLFGPEDIAKAKADATARGAVWDW